MAATGGMFPFIKAGALVGPGRTLFKDVDEDVDEDISEIISMVNVAGEYPVVSPWRDSGLAADAPSLTHDKDVSGIEYQNTAAPLFEALKNIDRTATLQIAEINEDNIRIIENTLAEVEALIASSPGVSAQHKLGVGIYSGLAETQIAMIFQRPVGSSTVTEPDGTERPALVCRYIPRASLAPEKTELQFDREDPVNAEVVFNILPFDGAPAGCEHGYWLFEGTDQIIPGS